jgi:hypothetical protein
MMERSFFSNLLLPVGLGLSSRMPRLTGGVLTVLGLWSLGSLSSFRARSEAAAALSSRAVGP